LMTKLQCTIYLYSGIYVDCALSVSCCLALGDLLSCQCPLVCCTRWLHTCTSMAVFQMRPQPVMFYFTIHLGIHVWSDTDKNPKLQFLALYLQRWRRDMNESF
jgi:hypothetical protein